MRASSIEEKISMEKLKLFFKKAAEESAKNEPGSITSSDFFQSKETAEDKSLHDRWMAYVQSASVKNESKEIDKEAADRKFFKAKDLPLLTLEYQKWFSGAENNFKAAKIFKERYDEYDLCLTSALPENKKPAHGKIYFEKSRNGKLFYLILNDATSKTAGAELDIPVEGDLTVAFLESKKSEILKTLSANKHALFGQEAFNRYLTLKPQESDLIPKVIITGKDLCIPGYENYKYYLTKLDSRDPRAAVLGKYTNCCQSLLNQDGHQRAVYGIEKPNSGFYVICKMKGETPDPLNDHIVAQTWAWRQNDALVLDAVVALAQESAGQVRGMACHHIDVWTALYQQLARTLVEQPAYGLAKVTARIDELRIKNLGGIIGSNSLATVNYPHDYTPYEDGNQDDERLLRFSYNHQTILALGNTPLYILYMLSNDNLALAPSEKEKLEASLSSYINSKEGFERFNALINNWTINTEKTDTVAILRTLDSICKKVIEPNRKQMMSALDSLFHRNAKTLLEDAGKSTLLVQWWFQKATTLLSFEQAFKLALDKALESGNMDIFNQLRTFPRFTEMCEKTKISEREKINPWSWFDDEDDYEYLNFSPLTKAIKCGSLEVVKGLREEKVTLNEQDLKIAFKYFMNFASENTWHILQFVLEEAAKIGIKPQKEQLDNVLKQAMESLEDKKLAENVISYMNKLLGLNQPNSKETTPSHEATATSSPVEPSEVKHEPLSPKTQSVCSESKMDNQGDMEVQPAQIETINLRKEEIETSANSSTIMPSSTNLKTTAALTEESPDATAMVVSSSPQPSTQKIVVSSGPTMYGATSRSSARVTPSATEEAPKKRNNNWVLL